MSDVVSVGDLGSNGPTNVVYRNNWNPITAHKLVQWGGETGLAEHDEESAPIEKAELPVDLNHDGVPDIPSTVADDYELDLGDDFDGDSWNVYWNQ